MEKAKLKLHKKACNLLGIDTAKIKFVTPSEYKAVTGKGVGTDLGIANYKHLIYYVRRGEPLRTYIHEILHLLFQHRPHWWIYCVAWKLTGQKIMPGRGRNYGYGNGFFVDTSRIKELPSRAKLRKLIQRAYKRL